AALPIWNADHRLLRRSGCLRDCLGNLARLAVAEARAALAVADDDERGETKALTALHRLRDAVDVHELFNQLFAAILVARAPVVAAATATVTTPATTVAAATATAGTTGVFGRLGGAFGVLNFVCHH